MSSAPSNDELEGELVNPLEEDIEVVFDNQVNEKLKSKTLTQLKEAKASADLVSNSIGECIQEIEEKVSSSLREEKCFVSPKVSFEEPLDRQFNRIFGIEMPGIRLSVEEFYKFIAPVLKLMKQDDVTFFYEHYGGVIPKGMSRKLYF